MCGGVRAVFRQSCQCVDIQWLMPFDGLILFSRRAERAFPQVRKARSALPFSLFAVRKSPYGASEQAFLRDAPEHAASPFHFFGIVKDIFPVYHILFMKLFLSKYFTVGNVFLFIPRHARDMTHT